MEADGAGPLEEAPASLECVCDRHVTAVQCSAERCKKMNLPPQKNARKPHSQRKSSSEIIMFKSARHTAKFGRRDPHGCCDLLPSGGRRRHLFDNGFRCIGRDAEEFRCRKHQGYVAGGFLGTDVGGQYPRANVRGRGIEIINWSLVQFRAFSDS
jgi:hypothetical protein